MAKIKGRVILLLLLLVIFFLSVPMAKGYYDEGEEAEEEERERRGDRGDRGGRGRRGGDREDTFLLQDSKQIIATEAGEMRVVRGFTEKGIDEFRLHIGFINMEPKSLFIPQYIDSSLILFVRRGEVKIGWIYKEGLVEKQLEIGDVYRIPAGSAFYLLNTGEGQRLQIICCIDRSESIGRGPFQSFFIGGGRNPVSVINGFDRRTMKAAFNISARELDDILTRQEEGPIVFVPDAHQPGKLASFLQLKQRERLEGLKGVEVEEQDDDDEEVVAEEKQEQQETWTWRKLIMESVMGKQQQQNKEGDRERERKRKRRTLGGSLIPYNLYNRDPDFQNSYGWSLAIDKHDYPPLKHSNIGVYLVNLTAGAMMAPHVNPSATEYGIVLSGEGSVQVVHPDGSLAMDAEVDEGKVFMVPRYFPFCQIASREGPMEFFGFTTSARRNRPQFLVGATSILQMMKGPELATAFGISPEKLDKLVESQYESVILPTVPKLSPEEEEGEEEPEREREGDEKKKKKQQQQKKQ